MTVVYHPIVMPEGIHIEEESFTPTFARFIVEPFERGFGHTVGNALRRMLLNSIESPAIIGLRIEGMPHEFMALEGIVEDATNIILNFKSALLRKLPLREEINSREPRLYSTRLEISQEDLDSNERSIKVTLGRLLQAQGFEIVNPSLLLFTVTRPVSLDVDFRLAFGRGYVTSERHEIDQRLEGEMLLDAAFSPVRLVNYYVENTRVGQDTDYDRLILEVETDGRITPMEATSFASQICIRQFGVFDQLKVPSLSFDEMGNSLSRDADELMAKLVLRISDIEFSVRASNCLTGAEIEFVAELVTKPESELLKFRNFGKKSLSEIRAKLTEMGLHLGMDLSPYKLNRDNIREFVQSYLEERAQRA